MDRAAQEVSQGLQGAGFGGLDWVEAEEGWDGVMGCTQVVVKLGRCSAMRVGGACFWDFGPLLG